MTLSPDAKDLVPPLLLELLELLCQRLRLRALLELVELPQQLAGLLPPILALLGRGPAVPRPGVVK